MELKACATKYDLKEEKYGHTAFQHPQVRPRTLLIKSERRKIWSYCISASTSETKNLVN